MSKDDYVTVDGQPIAQIDWNMIVFLAEAGYDPRDEDIQDAPLDDLMPRMRGLRWIYLN